MLVLGIDSSSPVNALGLFNQSGLLGEVNIRLHNRHSERLLANIDFLLKGAGYTVQDLAGIAVATGPGSFTGLRIALSTVKTMIQVLGIPVVGLSTLDLLAYNLVQQPNWLVPVIDAGRNRVYTALFREWKQDIRSVKEREDRAIPLEQLLAELAEIKGNTCFVMVGDGVSAYRDILGNSPLPIRLATANSNTIRGSVVAELGYYYLQQGVSDHYLELLPNYLKKPQAELNWQKKYRSGGSKWR